MRYTALITVVMKRSKEMREAEADPMTIIDAILGGMHATYAEGAMADRDPS